MRILHTTLHRRVGRRSWAQQRVRLGLPLAIVYLWLAAPTPHSLLAGGVLMLLGLLVRGAAASSLRKGGALTTWGPYAVSRHPLYLGSLLVFAGFIVAAQSWPVAVVGIGYFALFYRGAIRHEESRLRARYGRAFDDYAARVPCFWPRPLAWLRALRSGPSLTLYLRNNEYEAAIGCVAGLAVLLLKWTLLSGALPHPDLHAALGSTAAAAKLAPEGLSPLVE